MRLAFVYLSELLLVVDLDADSVLEYVLNMLFAEDGLPIFIRSRYDLLKV